MARSDRLLTLSTYRLALRSANMTSADAVLHAAPDQLARHRKEILRLVGERHPDVMRALFCPQEPIDWQVALITASPGTRHLWVTKGAVGRIDETLVSTSWRLGDADAERRAWRALVAAISRRSAAGPTRRRRGDGSEPS